VVQVNGRYIRADFLDPYLKMLVLLLARFRQHPAQLPPFHGSPTTSHPALS